MPRRYKKRSYRRPKKNLKKIITQQIRSMAETKKLVTSFAGTSLSTTITDDSLLDSVAQGTGSDDRIGDDIFVTGVYGRYILTTGDATQIVRMILYTPRREDVTLSSQSQDDVTSLLNPVNFNILADRMVTLSTYQPIKRGTIKYKFKGKGMKVSFDPDTGTIQDKRLRLAIVSDSGAVPHPSIHMEFITYWKDY